MGRFGGARRNGDAGPRTGDQHDEAHAPPTHQPGGRRDRRCALAALAAPAAQAAATTPSLGTAANFAAVAATTITNTGPTSVNGDLGVFPGRRSSAFRPARSTARSTPATRSPTWPPPDAETAYSRRGSAVRLDALGP